MWAEVGDKKKLFLLLLVHAPPEVKVHKPPACMPHAKKNLFKVHFYQEIFIQKPDGSEANKYDCSVKDVCFSTPFHLF